MPAPQTRFPISVFQPAKLQVHPMKTNASLPDAAVTRRNFLQTSIAAASAVTILPRHVLGGAGGVAPSEKLTVAYIGCGTQGIRELLRLLTIPEVQVVAVCDPVEEGNDYVDWSKDGLR